MSYVIQWSSELNNDTNPAPASIGKSTITIVNNSTDTTSTSLSLTGQGLSGYGAIQQENFIRLMENFASQTAPISPTVGQQWFDTTTNTLSVYCQTATSPAAYAWESVFPINLPHSIPVISATAPVNPEVGVLWYNTTTNVLSIYTASNTITGAPPASGGWTPVFNAMPGSSVTSLSGTANQITLTGSTGAVNIALASNVVINSQTSGIALNIAGANSASTALYVVGPVNNTSFGAYISSGNVTAGGQITPVLMLQQLTGAAYGGNGSALMLGAISNNSADIPIAGIWSALSSGGTGGGHTDHFGALVLGTKDANNSGPVSRVAVDYAYNMYPTTTNAGAIGVPSARWSALYAGAVYVDVLNGSGAGIYGGSIPLASLAASTINVVAGAGLSGGGQISLGQAVGLTNTGVTSLGAGAGISINAATGGVTVTNTGVRTLSASTGIGVSATTGAITITNTGVTSFNGRVGAVALSAADVNAVYGYTPANGASYVPLSDFANNGGANPGYIKMPNGLYFQWGTTPSQGSGNAVAFPVAMSHTVISLTITATGANVQGTYSAAVQPGGGSFIIYCQQISSYSWFAVGY